MSTPVPAPRNSAATEQKKPVPTPRKCIPIAAQQQVAEDNQSSPKSQEVNTFSRRVRTLSLTSKEIAGKVQEKKKAVIEGTRQSVRKITRRFTSADTGVPPPTSNTVEDDSSSESLSNIFDSISFQSPLVSEDDFVVYNNVTAESDHSVSNTSDESNDNAPPIHPPPPLRSESIYDQPQSFASGSTNSTSSSSNPVLPHNPYDYERVYPLYPYNSDTDSCIAMTAGTIDRNVELCRSESWNFYDPLSKTENLYNNIDITPTLSAISSLVMNSLTGNNSETNNTISRISLNSNLASCELRNVLYVNHDIVPPPRTKRPNKSVLLQFDPLNDIDSVDGTPYSNINDRKALEVLFDEDLYGNMLHTSTYDNLSNSNDSESEEYLHPPTPPARFDSLPEDSVVASTSAEKMRTSWFTVNDAGVKRNNSSGTEQKKLNWLKSDVFKNVLKKAPDIIKSNKSKDNTVNRPALSPKGSVQQRGMLYKITYGPVEDLFGEFSSRWCVLEQGSLICYSDNTSETIKENFPMNNVLSAQILLDQKYKYKYENEDLHCFEINVSGKNRSGLIYGSRSISERRMWMQRLAESFSKRFNAKITSEYARIGWGYIREGVSGEWEGAWVVLSKRTLYYAVDMSPIKSIDLRKARCIVLHHFEENGNNPRTNDKGPNMLVDCQSGAIYLRMWTSRETKAWCHVVRLAAHNNGPLLEQQQLTKNDVPVIVEKCINFIYAHGSMSEGIYRRSGSGGMVNELLTQFRRDAWAVQLTNDKFTEHDVANALKRFFRDLPEPLLTIINHQYLCQVSLVKNHEERTRMYRAVFDHFPPVSFQTVKKIFSHLHFINSQCKQNLMNVDNLAAVWGPTLMHAEGKDNTQYGQKESVVVAQLVNSYRNIFPENAEELDRERLMLQVLKRCTESPQGAVNTKGSGDLRVWVHLHNKEGQTLNVALGPHKTAYEVCVELSSKIKLPVHELVLEELVLNDKLTRPIHHKEKVLDVVLRWGYWDEADRKDNCLVLSQLSKYWEYINEKTLPVSGEFKFADSKSKLFKLYTFEFAQAKLSYYKDRTCATKLDSWNIEDLLWYIGHEPKRNPQSKWTITFILRKLSPNRTKSSPWFGNIIAWTDPTVRATWLAAMLHAEHPQDLIPPAQHINLMTN